MLEILEQIWQRMLEMPAKFWQKIAAFVIFVLLAVVIRHYLFSAVPSMFLQVAKAVKNEYGDPNNMVICSSQDLADSIEVGTILKGNSAQKNAEYVHADLTIGQLVPDPDFQINMTKRKEYGNFTKTHNEMRNGWLQYQPFGEIGAWVTTGLSYNATLYIKHLNLFSESLDSLSLENDLETRELVLEELIKTIQKVAGPRPAADEDIKYLYVASKVISSRDGSASYEDNPGINITAKPLHSWISENRKVRQHNNRPDPIARCFEVKMLFVNNHTGDGMEGYGFLSISQRDDSMNIAFDSSGVRLVKASIKQDSRKAVVWSSVLIGIFVMFIMLSCYMLPPDSFEAAEEGDFNPPQATDDDTDDDATTSEVPLSVENTETDKAKADRQDLQAFVPEPTDLQASVPKPTGPQGTGTGLTGLQITRTAHTGPQSTGTKPTDESDSDISDVEDEGYLDFSNTDNVHIKLDLKSCTKQSVTSLYLNSDKVYQMVDGVRGRALILSNRLFRDKPGSRRVGDAVDYANVSRLFEQMNFEIAKTEEDLTDLTAEEMLEEIKEETTLDIHHRYSMFVIVICSLGKSADRIICHDNKYVDLSTITKLLSASKFPAMKGKPKLVIVQASSGGGRDYGDSKHSNLTRVASATGTIEPDVAVDAEATDVKHSASCDVTLDSSDFFIMKASTESYVALRSHTHGSHFIRTLVATFYRHSCHRDLESLFKIIQERVRRATTKKRNADGSWYGGVIPESRCTFTNYRKLYFFPNFSLKNGSG